MCNLYSLTRNRDAILRLFRVSHNRAMAFEPMNAIFPNYSAPVVRHAADGEDASVRELVLMSWGFVLLQTGRAPKRVTNIRDDKVTSAFWRDSFEQRRCLVPASSFCEPNGDVKPATWHWFALRPASKGDDPRPLFAFPGVWRRYRGPIRKQGPNVDLEVYAFLTTTPNELGSTINHERMPVLLTGEGQFETWLNGTPVEALAPAQRYPADRMRIVQEGLDKEDLQAVA
jgi:putative SOS response-associated peptidase YedK